MRRYPTSLAHPDSELLPVRVVQQLKNDSIQKKSNHNSKTIIGRSSGKSKINSASFHGIFINIYLLMIVVFIIYHLDVVRSSFFPKKVELFSTVSNRDLNSNDSDYSTQYQQKNLSNVYQTNVDTFNKTRGVFVSDIVKNTVQQDNKEERNIGEVELAPLRYPIDYEKFTIRINTWKREEQLQLSIDHYSTCSAVAQIQIIWCVEQGEPPMWLLELEKVPRTTTNNSGINVSYPFIVIERHENNTLNERFLILEPIPTAGVLSVDDDVIRPCIAIHATFLRWTLNPSRQVGFDARSHGIETLNVDNSLDISKQYERWSYLYMSSTEKQNKYSLTLTRFSFQHQDYLKSYWNDIPSEVRDMIAEQFNCEDIAMSLWISAKTNGRPPLLANFWAVKSQIKMYVPVKISGGKNHKEIRNKCFDLFANIFQLKGKLNHTKLHHSKGELNGFFDYGEHADDYNQPHNGHVPLYYETMKIILHWQAKGQKTLVKELSKLTKEASQRIYEHGLIEKTQQWKKRFNPHG